VSDTKKVICKNCGTVNEVSDKSLAANGDWLECALAEGFEWILPAGKITPIIGDPIYISAQGEHLSYDAYLAEYGIDPEIAYNLMRGNGRVKPSSRINAAHSQVVAQFGAQVRSKQGSQSWLDDDDWTS
jgi:hypothetical protein